MDSQFRAKGNDLAMMNPKLSDEIHYWQVPPILEWLASFTDCHIRVLVKEMS